MILDIVYLIAGLALILYGANWLTDGSSAVARRLGVSDLIIGLTVVALGTSTPELVITIVSAIGGNAPLAVGNIVGSNIFNILVIIGLVAVISPIRVERSVMTTEIPLVVLSALILLVMANSQLLDGATDRVISRSDGLILLVFFILFMRHTFMSAHIEPEPELDPAAERPRKTKEMGMRRAVVMILAGLGALIVGGDRFVAGASAIASMMGVSDAVIGLTIVAIGTSLPELATSIVAARKGAGGLAIGNVIGSCVMNIFLILGVGATITPLALGGVTQVDLLTMTAASVLFWWTARFGGTRVINRAEGAIMLVIYAAYTAWLIATATV